MPTPAARTCPAASSSTTSFPENGIDPGSGSGHPTGIALFSAAVPVNVVVTGNRIRNEFWGIFVNGQFSIAGLASNRYTSVAHPVGP